MPVESSNVVIVGAGLAGLTLSRHLLLDTEKTVTLVERRERVPGPHQKVGESTVQVGGYYYSKVLDMEEYLLQKHYMKYNLRFYWRPDGSPGTRFEEYSQAYIRTFSNVVSYQLDRNTFEAELLRRNLESPRFRFVPSARVEEVELATGEGPHRLRVRTPDGVSKLEADWVVDTSGRGKLLAKRMGLLKDNPIRHAAFYWWVDGLVDIDRLTDASRDERLRKPQRRRQGHAPIWLATNHFCAEGLWFWVIPLQGKTSLGLVFEKRVLDHREVFTVERATRWVLERFPLFARDLPHRKVLDFGGLKDFSYDCQQTISPERWALAGEAGRFTDPLYSPGSDLISIHNTLIVDAIRTDDREALEEKCRLHEHVMRAVYKAYEPTYALSYDALGDPEVFALKYLWELTVYFATFVFPFLNGFLIDRRFVLPYLRALTRLGPRNAALQQLLSDFFHWKKQQGLVEPETILFDFADLEPLRRAERTFYEIGVTVEEGRAVLHRQIDYLDELARLIVAQVAVAVVGDPRVRDDHAFVSRIDLAALRFDPDATRRLWAEVGGREGRWTWTFDPSPLDGLAPGRTSPPGSRSETSPPGPLSLPGEGESEVRPGVVKGASVTPEKAALARRLRRAATDAEALAWEMLRDRRCLGLKFRRQQVIRGFVVDFYCAEHRLALELDGAVHDQRVDGDRLRDEALAQHGIRILRIRNEDLDRDCLAASLTRLLAGDLTPQPPLPAGRGGVGAKSAPATNPPV